ncbi:MAG: SUMF1/EgtB/PvdO family nonheme iron enzyme, partial [Treponema sp.]|nr:SUMF1/EgtB/PvdO family nonheme iron enzyme [Treponema sp.]
GLYDMGGNVYEWCWDLYNASVTAGDSGSASVTNPTGALSGSKRIFRGGSWMYYAADCTAACRGSFYPETCDNGRGFRVVRTAP